MSQQSGSTDRLSQQLDFIVQMDALKQVFRQTLLPADLRAENDAEHSWHLALMAIVLQEHAAEAVDITRVLRMHLIHDLVEIHAGDTFAYDDVGQLDKAEREQAAAEKIFALLPEDQEQEMRALWDEFETRTTPESRYAAALDRLQPLLLNYHTDGAAWKKHDVRYAQVIERNSHIAEGAPALWEFAHKLIDAARDEGKLAE